MLVIAGVVLLAIALAVAGILGLPDTTGSL